MTSAPPAEEANHSLEESSGDRSIARNDVSSTLQLGPLYSSSPKVNGSSLDRVPPRSRLINQSYGARERDPFLSTTTAYGLKKGGIGESSSLSSPSSSMTSLMASAQFSPPADERTGTDEGPLRCNDDDNKVMTKTALSEEEAKHGRGGRKSPPRRSSNNLAWSSTSSTTVLPYHHHTGDHLVHFYDSEELYYRAGLSFMLPALLHAEDAMLLIVTKQHMQAFLRLLADHNIDVDKKLQSGQLMVFETSEVYETLKARCGGILDITDEIFTELFGPKLAELEQKFRKMYAFGELVNTLAQLGEHAEALKLEVLWDDFIKKKDIAVFCAYHMGSFTTTDHLHVLEGIAACHSGIWPSTDRVSPASDPSAIEALKEKSRALELEVEKRKVTERALQACLKLLSSRAQEALHRERDNYRNILATLPVGILKLSADGAELFFNPRFVEITGLQEAELHSDAWLSSIHPEDQEQILEIWKMAKTEEGKLDKREYRFVLPDGSIRWVVGEWVSSRPFLDTVEGIDVVHTIVDVTHMKTMELERMKALRQAEELQRKRASEADSRKRYLSQFVDTLCHELRNPLGGIYGNVELLRAGLESRKKWMIEIFDKMPRPLVPAVSQQMALDEESLEAIEKCVRHQKVIADDVLNLSRLENGAMKLDLVDFEVHHVVRDVIKMFKTQAKKKGVVISEATPLQMARLRGDPARLAQILINLVSNALKYTAHGSITIHVKRLAPTQTKQYGSAAPRLSSPMASSSSSGTGISSNDLSCTNSPTTRLSSGRSLMAQSGYPDDDEKIANLTAGGGAKEDRKLSADHHKALFAIEVQDTGTGMTDEEKATVFNRFSTSGSSDYGGSGLGLYICKSLVELMGGKISVKSKRGGGSTFSFTFLAEELPATDEKFAEDEPEKSSHRSPQGVDSPLSMEGDLSHEGAEHKRLGGVPEQEAVERDISPTTEARATTARELDPEQTSRPKAVGARSMVEAVRSGPQQTLPESAHPADDQRVALRSSNAAKRATIDTMGVESCSEQRDSKAQESWRSQFRILVVDDNYINQKMMRRLILQKPGWDCEVAANGAEAVSIIEESLIASSPYDLIFMDIQMPVMDGIAATKAIRLKEAEEQEKAEGQDKRRRRIAIVGLSGNATPEHRGLALQAGMDYYLTKPVKSQRLFEVINMYNSMGH